jgi:hypothetical protein
MNAIITILVLSGLIQLAQSVCKNSANIAALNKQLFEGNVTNEFIHSIKNFSKLFLFKPQQWEIYNKL